LLANLFIDPMVVSVDNDVFIPQIKDYSFLKKEIFIPLGFREIVKAVRFFPIFFVKNKKGEILPIALMGIEGKNLFIDSGGRFQKNIYIPAVIRAYPFGIAEVKGDPTRNPIIVDRNYLKKEVKKKDDFYISDKQLTSKALEVVNLLKETYEDLELAKTILATLFSKGLLKNSRIDIKTSKGEFVLENLLVVDRKEIKRLKDKELVKLYKQEYLDIIPLFRVGLENIDMLVRLINEQQATIINN